MDDGESNEHRKAIVGRLPCHNLERVDLGAVPPPRDLWLLIRSDLVRVPRVRAVADMLIDLFRRENADLF